MGIPLPKFPEPVAPRFVNDVIRDIPEAWDHAPHLMEERSHAPYDGNTTTVNTITCSGGSGTKHAWHPLGYRDFTPREIACVQGIFRSHQFRFPNFRCPESYMKKAIGDMVPSEAWVYFLAEAIKTQEQFDAEQERKELRAASRAGASIGNPIDLD
jgi:hypothetical protein